MPTERSFKRLRRLFQSAASLSALAAVGACGGTATTLDPNTDGGGPHADGGPSTDGGVIVDAHDGGSITTGFDENVCTDGTYKPLAGVTAKDASDYLELRNEADQTSGTPPVSAVDTQGTACKTATDASKCKAALAAFRSKDGWVTQSGGLIAPTHQYVVYTRGDTVGAVTSLADLAAFLAPIDNAHDAALLASQRGHRFDCTKNNATKTGGGYDLLTETGSTCGAGTGIDQHVVAVTSAGDLSVTQTVRIQDGDPNCAVGRRPEGFVPSDMGSSTALGAYFAEIAELEAASVHAFERLEAELHAHGAPASLVEQARRAARDEVRHARTTARLARTFGGRTRAPRVEARPVRRLLDVALENAIEGCVRETFGALQATFQADRARDASVARAMRGIAVDETRHAALAWDVAAWADARLSDDERAQVAAARRAAVDRLERDLETEPSAEVAEQAGAPRKEEARLLFARVRRELWQA